MSGWLLKHIHAPHECGVAVAAWKGFQSPLRSHAALDTCREGGHAIWWVVEASGPDHALQQLPPYVAARTQAVPISEVLIP